MRVSDEARKALAAGFEEIVEQFKLPRGFPLPVLEAMQAIVSRCQVGAKTCYRYERRDVTSMYFVTLDPAASTDLDQAFVLEQDGDAILLHYALADPQPIEDCSQMDIRESYRATPAPSYFPFRRSWFGFIEL